MGMDNLVWLEKYRLYVGCDGSVYGCHGEEKKQHNARG